MQQKSKSGLAASCWCCNMFYMCLTLWFITQQDSITLLKKCTSSLTFQVENRSFFVCCASSVQFIAWCTCPCILAFLPLASLPRTQRTHSTCTLGSAWEIWNGYNACSAWLDWDIDETARCPYPGGMDSSFWVIRRFFCAFTGPPAASLYMCLSLRLFVWTGSACTENNLCLRVGGEPAGRVASKSDSTAWLQLPLLVREL